MTFKKRIMIVEDEALIAMRLYREMRKFGYDVSKPVATGQEAVSRATSEKPDLMLMDIRLAGDMDGIQAAEIINQSHKTPVIFMTGYPDEEMRRRADALHPLAYLIKPVNANSLLDLIQDIV